MNERERKAGILFSALIIAVGGIVYELIIGAVSSYLLSDSVLQYSLTIGFMLFGMGIGSLLAPKFASSPERNFIVLESSLAVLGGFAPTILFAVFATRYPIYPVFLTLVVAIGLLIGFEIPFMFQMVRGKNDELHVLSRILALDYIGALIASLAFPLVLLPLLGVLRSALVMGLGNVIIAGFILYAFRDELRNRRFVTIYWLFTAALLLFGVIRAESLATKLDQGLYRDPIVFSQQTPYQKITMTKRGEDLRLFVDGNLQFSSIDERRYHEALVHVPMMFAKQRDSVLIIGGGDGLTAREVLKYPEVQNVLLVDIDEQMTRMASTHNAIVDLNEHAFASPRLSVVNKDALEYMRTTEKMFDVVIIDLPDPNNEALAKLYTTEWYRTIGAQLAPVGVMVTQATSPYYGREAFWTIEESVHAAGLVTKPYHFHVPSFGEWGFVIGSKHPLDERKIKLADVPLMVLKNETVPGMFVFDADMVKPTEIEPNTMLHPILLKEYLHGARNWE